jgi:SAM-dependent methyltransferase
VQYEEVKKARRNFGSNPSRVTAAAIGGAGMDLLLAARRTGPRGRAIGIDMTDAMVERARAVAAGLSQMEVRRGDATALPVDTSSVGVVISNGDSISFPKKSWRSPRSFAFSGPAADCSLPISQSIWTSPKTSGATSIYGRVE